MKKDLVTRSVLGLNFNDVNIGTKLDVFSTTVLNRSDIRKKKIKTVTVLEKYDFLVVCEDEEGKKDTYCSGDYYCMAIKLTPEYVI